MLKYRSRRDRMAAERDLVGESGGAPEFSFVFSSELRVGERKKMIIMTIIMTKMMTMITPPLIFTK